MSKKQPYAERQKDAIFDWISNNVDPAEVFGHDNLMEWAKEHGMISTDKVWSLAGALDFDISLEYPEFEKHTREWLEFWNGEYEHDNSVLGADDLASWLYSLASYIDDVNNSTQPTDDDIPF